MAVPRLPRWQKGSALGVMGMLLGTWVVAVGGLGPAPAANGGDADDIPDVPTTEFSMPASVQPLPPGINPKEGAKGTLKNLSVNGIPTTALAAYHRSETLLSQADKSCKLPWHLVAAIGRVESNHGRTGGSALDIRGNAHPPIIGIPLNGSNNTAKITDTDNGSLDGDTQFDRAVGPMQFIPSTWKAVAVDANNDGGRNPQNVYDAATATGIYLCSGTGDLSTAAGARPAVLRYNNSGKYADLVLAISAAYKKGQFSETTNGVPSGNGGTTGGGTGTDGGGGSTTDPTKAPTKSPSGGGTTSPPTTKSPSESPTTSPTRPTQEQIQAYCREQHPKSLLDLLDTKYKQCLAEQYEKYGY